MWSATQRRLPLDALHAGRLQSLRDRNPAFAEFVVRKAVKRREDQWGSMGSESFDRSHLISIDRWLNGRKDKLNNGGWL